jgi:hypothetical protein
MVAMAALCTTTITHCRLLIHLVGGDLIGGVEEAGDSSGRRFHEVVELIQSTCGRGLVLEDLDKFKGSIAATSALGRRFDKIHKWH